MKAIFAGLVAVPRLDCQWPARPAQVTIDASNQIGVAQMTDQIPVVMQSTGRNCVNVTNLARHPG